MSETHGFLKRDKEGRAELPKFLRELNQAKVTQAVLNRLERTNTEIKDLSISIHEGTVTIHGSTRDWFTINIAVMAAEAFIDDPNIEVQHAITMT